MEKRGEPMERDGQVSLVGLLTSLSRSLDFTRRGLLQHHRRVGLMALRLAAGLGLEKNERQRLFLAAMVHDAGAVTFREKAALEDFDVRDTWAHALRGARLLQRSSLLAPAADIVLAHHDRWDGGNPSGLSGAEIPLPARIIHLVDRADVLCHHYSNILAAREEVGRRLAAGAGSLFDPELVAAFEEVGAPEGFWLDLTSPFLEEALVELAGDFDLSLGLEDLLRLGEFYAAVIDAKNSFTHRHSRGVAAVAAALARRLGFPPRECRLVRLAGLLHDLGKVSVPEDILDKPAGLTPEEFNLIKQHTYYTYRLLKPVGGLFPVREWAAFHHERPDGTGYPFRKRSWELDPGARLLAVADVFTALSEERPYRPRLPQWEIASVLRAQAAAGALDANVVTQALAGYEELEAERADSVIPFEIADGTGVPAGP